MSFERTHGSNRFYSSPPALTHHWGDSASCQLQTRRCAAITQDAATIQAQKPRLAEKAKMRRPCPHQPNKVCPKHDILALIAWCWHKPPPQFQSISVDGCFLVAKKRCQACQASRQRPQACGLPFLAAAGPLYIRHG